MAYVYENGSIGNTARRKSVTYPDGEIYIGYGSASGADDLDEANRRMAALGNLS